MTPPNPSSKRPLAPLVSVMTVALVGLVGCTSAPSADKATPAPSSLPPADARTVEGDQKLIIDITLKQANMLGTALLQYAMQHDGALPGPGTDMNVLLKRYLPKGKPLAFEPATPTLPAEEQKFIYTFKGGKIGSGAVGKELGYKDSPFGRAILYGDGRARWRPYREANPGHPTNRGTILRKKSNV